MAEGSLARVVADTPLDEVVLELLEGRVEVLPWDVALEGTDASVTGLYIYGHLTVDGLLMDRLPSLKIISNYGVGVDHINLADAQQRNIPVGNTPGVLNGATADMALTLLLAAGRRLVEGDRYARGPEFTHYDPGYILGREIHGTTLGIIGMGRIGTQVARRALGFDMRVLYHNRHRRADVEAELGVRYAEFETLLAESDYVVLMVPLTDETRGLIDAAALGQMKPTATLVNISRGPVVDTQALYEALRDGVIASAGLDVTDPEPLPRDHPLLALENVTIAPHLGSATIETRQKMAEMSAANLLAGLAGEELLNRVGE
ncbi:MAG: D-glycerate dehydrogenase [Planctomycetes bacterium]|nr:D-glycerate dehydrogenase [Planctomycetota bacterium]